MEVIIGTGRLCPAPHGQSGEDGAQMQKSFFFFRIRLQKSWEYREATYGRIGARRAPRARRSPSTRPLHYRTSRHTRWLTTGRNSPAAPPAVERPPRVTRHWLLQHVSHAVAAMPVDDSEPATASSPSVTRVRHVRAAGADTSALRAHFLFRPKV
jgi:hypothetical protein